MNGQGLINSEDGSSWQGLQGNVMIVLSTTPGSCQSLWSHMSDGAVSLCSPENWTTVMGPGLDKSQSKPFINWNQGLRTDSPQMGSCIFYAYPSLDSQARPENPVFK